jgi:hypothetical protein
MDMIAGPVGLARFAAWRDAVRRVRSDYAAAHGRPPRLLRPRRYTEKMQWRKLFDLDPFYAILCDKLASRDFVASRVGTDALPPLLWSGSDNDIPFDRLSPPYVLKSTHGSGHVVMVGAGEAPDRDDLRAQGAAWLAQRHGPLFHEPGYNAVPPRLLVERTVTGPSGERPQEVRFFMFDGRVGVINTVFIEDGRIRNGAFHTPDWRRLDWYFTRRVDRPFPPPRRLEDMARMARQVSAGIDHVRVDFYDGGERIWVGETTMYSWSGYSPFDPEEADRILGAAWRLRHPLRRAVMAVLLRQPGVIPAS